MITKKRILAAALAAPAALAFAAPAHAQVNGAIATTDPLLVVARTKAYEAASKDIDRTFKPTYDAMQKTLTDATNAVKPLITQLDTDKDGKLSDAEIEAASKVPAKASVLQKIADTENKANADLRKAQVPVSRAEAYAIENILQKYDAALLSIVNSKKIGVVLRPSVFVYAPDAADITNAVVAEIDRTAPTVSIQVPANWNPQSRTVSMHQALSEAKQRAYQLEVLRQQQAQQQQSQQGQARPAPSQPSKPEPR